jgi:DeoR/GlpR family transcriptional regulator of sugar metabolism
MNERQIAILNKVANVTKINVDELSKEFGVSQVTIRQDLKILEQNGVLKRFHGGAMVNSDDDIMKRLSFNYDAKLQIARKAASLVNNGETVMIESGSTNALLARELAKKSDITIITNSTFISRFVRNQNIKIVVLGGDYQHESEVNVGPLTRICINEFHVDKVFIGVDGFSPQIGFTCINMMRAEVTRAMTERAQKCIVVTDSTKFEKLGVSCSLKPSEVDIVITDTKISEENINILKSIGIEVLIGDLEI